MLNNHNTSLYAEIVEEKVAINNSHGNRSKEASQLLHIFLHLN